MTKLEILKKEKNRMLLTDGSFFNASEYAKISRNINILEACKYIDARIPKSMDPNKIRKHWDFSSKLLREMADEVITCQLIQACDEKMKEFKATNVYSYKKSFGNLMIRYLKLEMK